MYEQVINYCLIRFMPYADIGEFVNVGVVAFSPVTHEFDFRIEESKYRRITQFFPELDGANYTNFARAFAKELKNFAKPFASNEFKFDKSQLKDSFKNLIAEREGIYQFSPIATRLVNDIHIATEEIFQYYVLRGYVDKEANRETRMVDSLRSQLTRIDKIHEFQSNQRVGNDEYHVKLPLVHKNGEKALKPLDLGKTDSSAIYRHGDDWVVRFHRLKRLDLLPETFIPIETARDGKLKKIGLNFIEELNGIKKVTAVQKEDTDRLEFFLKKGK